MDDLSPVLRKCAPFSSVNFEQVSSIIGRNSALSMASEKYLPYLFLKCELSTFLNRLEVNAAKESLKLSAFLMELSFCSTIVGTSFNELLS
jgi:hypothetical protein